MEALTPQEIASLSLACRTCNHAQSLIKRDVVLDLVHESVIDIDIKNFVKECDGRLSDLTLIEARHEACNRRYIREIAKVTMSNTMKDLDQTI